MRLLPRAGFTIVSPPSAGEVRGRLSHATGPAPSSVFQRNTRPFTGTIRGDSFDVTRTSRERNSFRPLIRGTVEAITNGTRLEGTLRLHEAVVAIMAVFTVVPGLVLLRLVTDSLRSGHLNEATPSALAVVLFMPAMMLGGFALESRRALRDLAAVVEASGSELN